MTELRLIAGIELGGTKCVALLATGPDDVRDRVTVPTTDPQATLAAIEGVLDRWTFDAIGVASFGPVGLDPARADYGAITATTKPGWSGTDLIGRLTARTLALPVEDYDEERHYKDVGSRWIGRGSSGLGGVGLDGARGRIGLGRSGLGGRRQAGDGRRHHDRGARVVGHGFVEQPGHDDDGRQHQREGADQAAAGFHAQFTELGLGAGGSCRSALSRFGSLAKKHRAANPSKVADRPPARSG